MTIEITASALARVGDVTVRRALPRRQRRTIGAWCFADHMGPVEATPTHGLDVGPHPHCGLQTVTWLTQGEVLHHDSLGSVQLRTEKVPTKFFAVSGIAATALHSFGLSADGSQSAQFQPAATVQRHFQ